MFFVIILEYQAMLHYKGDYIQKTMGKLKRGLNLAELCVSICLLCTVIVIILGILCGGLIGIRKGEENMIIGNIIKTELEYYSEAVLYNFDKYSGSHLVKQDKAVDGVKLKEEWISFDEEVNDNRNKIKKITVSIYWYDKGLSGRSGIKKKTSMSWVTNYLD